MKLLKRHKTKKSKPKKQPKPVDPNSPYGKFRQWVTKLEQRQENDRPNVVVRDEETHVCKHCGTEFTGGYCPKCSMPARWQRFNWRLLFLNFMDIWGLGNRPMFRTIRDLFWRPGYMIKDYLHGHHLSYFPPFKMLAVLTVLLVFVIWLVQHMTGGVQGVSTYNVDEVMNHLSDDANLSVSYQLLAFLENVYDYLKAHPLYSIILQNILVVIAVKWAFRKVSNFNYVETFIAVIYINCQFLIIAIANYLYTWNVSDGWGIFLYSSSLSYFAPLVATYDFHQLYGIKWKQALKKTIVATIIFLLLIAFGAIILFGSVYLIDLFFGVDPTYIPDVRHHVGLEPY